jgi:flavin reductase (DIM6/NTAB) family NADH-FMN oxidoreductase RutF
MSAVKSRAKRDGKAGAIDHALFRRVMGSFATGVTVISTEARGEVRGMTANAFMSGSLEPPLCVISVARRARIHPFLVEAGHFGVSILAKEQEKLSTHFAGGPAADAAPEFVRVGRTPLLPGAAATIAADIVTRHDCGDHTVFIGRIVHLGAHARAPLIVHEGRYASLTYSKERVADWVADFW